MKDPEYKIRSVHKIITTKHVVTVPLNTTRDKLFSALSNVPCDAKVSMIVSDDEAGFFGELVFTEEQESTE